MDCTNSPCSIKVPEGYEEILGYLEKGPHPGFERTQRILEAYLENIRYENCEWHPEVTAHVFRRPPFTLQAVDFDAVPGEGISWGGKGNLNDDKLYRKDTAMEIREMYEAQEKKFAFDCGWERLGLVLSQGEFVCYSFACGNSAGKKLKLGLTCRTEEEGQLQISLGSGSEVTTVFKKDTVSIMISLGIIPAGSSKETIKIHSLNAKVLLTQLHII